MSELCTTKRPRMQLGTVLDGRFELVEWLGAGSFGDVYRAKQLVFGKRLRDVAVKLFDMKEVPKDQWREHFHDAVQLIGLQEEEPSLSIRQHLIQVYDVGIVNTPEQHAYISMRLVPGRRTLQNAIDRWKPNGMAVATSLRFLQQILIPLAWMHSLAPCAVHGDIKPDNILLGEDGQLILTDFGLAGRMPVGTEGGAIQYLTPEQLLKSSVHSPDRFAGPESDVFALGIVWYEMLTGRHPYREAGIEATAANDFQALILAHTQARKWEMRPQRDAGDWQRIPLPLEFNVDMKEHPQVEIMLRRCLAYKPSERYANARLLRDDVERYLAGSVPHIENLVPTPDKTVTILTGMETDDLEARLSDAVALLNLGRHTDALQRIEGILARHPKNIPALCLKARALARTRGYSPAMEVYVEAKTVAPDSPEVMDAAAEVCEVTGNQTLAKKFREDANKLRYSSLKGRR